MASVRPELVQAWRYRNLSNQDRQNAQQEFRQLERYYDQVRNTQVWTEQQPKANVLAQIEQRAQQLQHMMNAHKILNQTWSEVRSRANKLAPPMTAEDMDVNFVRGEISQISRGASRPVNMVDPPPAFGSMTDSEFRNWKRQHLGWE